MSRKVTLPQTEAEKKLLEISKEQWGQYQNLFVPLEDSWLQDIEQRTGDRQEAGDIMAAEAAHQYGQFEKGTFDQAFANGIAPSSGSFLALASDLANEKANAASSGITSARNAETLDYANSGLKALGYGRGMGSEGIGGTFSSGVRSQVADNMHRAQDDFIDNASDQTRYSIYNAAGGIAGLAGGFGLDQYTKKSGSSVIPVQGPSGATVKQDHKIYQNMG